MTSGAGLDALLARFVEHHVRTGEVLPLDDLCGGREELREPLRRAVERYLRLDRTLERGTGQPSPEDRAAGPLPAFDGFQTIERIGCGGMGEVYKLRDLRLGRLVAAKVLRSDSAVRASLRDFLQEARSLALFRDDRIVQIHEFRADAEPPVLLMEFVEGFELGRIAPSLEFAQRARILAEVCDAVQHAHWLGIQHRDLKPQNIMLDARLRPKILDFGLSGGDPRHGHLRGTPRYMAPEQLDPSCPLDARTDVYALGVILYEVLCGEVPYPEVTPEKLAELRSEGPPRLPAEIDPAVPEPLQAIALRAMEADPDLRYPSAREMGLDLRRFLDGRPVLARPTAYASALGRRLRPHLEHVEEWLRLKLIYPHEADSLRAAYHRLEAREDDWIVESRVLSLSQIALYLGVFVMALGGLFYFGAHRIHEAIHGLGGPLLALGTPIVLLSAAAHLLYRREQKAAGVAFSLASVLLLPVLLMLLFYETGWWAAPAEAEGQLLAEAAVSNRQLQIAAFLACAWAALLALRTRTTGLSSLATALGILAGLAVLADLGLRGWLEEGRWDLLGLHLAPILTVAVVLGAAMERTERPWFARPLYVSAALLLVAVLELLAQDGQALRYLGITLQGYQSPEVADPLLLDTLTFMSWNGALFYAVALLADRFGREVIRPASWLLLVIAPFAALEPLAWLSHTADYSRNLDWMYLALSLGVAFLSHHRQRRAFYYAGVINTGMALWLLASHYEWFDRPAWAVGVLAAGLLLLAAGLRLDRLERTRRRAG